MQRKVLKHGHNTKLLCNIAAAALNGLHLPPTLFWLGDLGLFPLSNPLIPKLSDQACNVLVVNGTKKTSFEEHI